jgi:hypothetical protein
MDIILKIHNLFVGRAYAQSLGGRLAEGLSGLEGGQVSDAPGLVDAIIGIAVPLAVICVVVLVIYAGYILMSSQGNPDKLKEGKEILTNAIIGFLVILLSVAILLLISNSLGLGIYG